MWLFFHSIIIIDRCDATWSLFDAICLCVSLLGWKVGYLGIIGRLKLTTTRHHRVWWGESQPSPQTTNLLTKSDSIIFFLFFYYDSFASRTLDSHGLALLSYESSLRAMPELRCTHSHFNCNSLTAHAICTTTRPIINEQFVSLTKNHKKKRMSSLSREKSRIFRTMELFCVDRIVSVDGVALLFVLLSNKIHLILHCTQTQCLLRQASLARARCIECARAKLKRKKIQTSSREASLLDESLNSLLLSYANEFVSLLGCLSRLKRWIKHNKFTADDDDRLVHILWICIFFLLRFDSPISLLMDYVIFM